MTHSKTYTALVSFERKNLKNPILPEEAWGAVGYMAVICKNPEEIFELFRNSLLVDDLRLIDVEEISEFTSIDQVANIDPHLANNVEEWEAGKKTVWGTLHNYYAEGEA